MEKLINNIGLILSLFVVITITSCGRVSDTTPPTPAKKDYKIQVQVGTNSNVLTSQILGDTDAVELDPNDAEKLAIVFKVLEGNTSKTSGVTYTVAPTLSSVTGVTAEPSGGAYRITIEPSSYAVNTDVTYTLTATIGSEKVNRDFKIKGKIATTTLTYKIQATVGSDATALLTATALGDTDAVELDPNGTILLIVGFIVLEGTTPKTSGVNYVISPDLPSGVISQSISDYFGVKITPAGFTATTDVTYTLTATIGTGANIITKTRDFKIKGKVQSIPVTSVTLGRKPTQQTTTATAGDSPVNLTEVFDVTVMPETATNKNVIWSIENGDNNVATISDVGVLSMISAGTVTVKVTSLDNSEKSSTGDFTIVAASTAIAVTSLTLSRKNSNTIKGEVGSNVDLTKVFDIAVEPTNATNKSVIWSLDTTTIASITDAGILTPSSVGTVNVKVTSVTQTGISSTSVEFVVTTYKIQATVGGDATALLTATALGDTDAVELDPNGTMHLIVGFIALEGTTPKTSGINYVISPDLPSGAISQSISEYFGVKITPADFTATTDVTYTLTATIGTDANTITKTRDFKIKGKTDTARTSLTVTGLGSTTSITTNGGTLQMSAIDGSTDVTSTATWSVTEIDDSATTKATISATGLVTVVANGIVRVKAKHGSKEGTVDITITNQTTTTSRYKIQARVNSIALNDTADVELDPNDTNKLVAHFVVLDGTTPTTEVSFSADTNSLNTANGVRLSLLSGTTFVVTIIPENYTKTADATYTLTARIGSGTSAITKTRDFKIKGKTDTTVTSLILIGAGNATTITTKLGTLQISVRDGVTAVTTAIWTVTEIDGTATTKATISSTGVLIALANGMVRVKAVATNGKEGTIDITTSNQIPSPTYNIQARVASNSIALLQATSKLDNTADVELDPNGTDKLVLAFIMIEGNDALTKGISYEISPTLPTTGVTSPNFQGYYLITLTPATYIESSDATYTITARIGTGTNAITRTREFKIKGKIVLESTLTVKGAGNATTITTNGGTLQMSVMEGSDVVASPTWTVSEIDDSPTSKATISSAGELTAVINGIVRVKAVHGSKEGTVDITISNQIVTEATYKIQARVAGTIINIPSTTPLGDSAIVELDPNGTDKLVLAVILIEGSIQKSTGVNYAITPSLPRGAISNTIQGYFGVNLTPIAFTATSDVTYTITATFGTIIETRDFIIKGKTATGGTSLSVTGLGSTTSITTNGGTLQLSAMDGTTAVASPTWSVTETDDSATTKATISATGLLTAVANGIVRVKAVASNGKEGTVDITISNQ